MSEATSERMIGASIPAGTSNTSTSPPSFAFDDPDFYLGDEFSAYRWLRREAPVYWHEPSRVWAISKHADIQSVSRNPDVFSSGRGVLVRDATHTPDHGALPPSIIYMDPPKHARYRRLVNQAFTRRMIAELEPRVREIARASLDAVTPGEVVDFVEQVAVPLPMLIIAEMLGVPGEDHADFKRWSDAAILGADVGREAEEMRVLGELFKYFAEKLAERRVRPGDDLVSALANAELDGERLSDGDLLMFCLTLLVAGNETTRNLITGGGRALIDHPDQWQVLKRNPAPALVENAVEEMLRYVTPVRAFTRSATCDTEIRGQKIAAGDFVLLLYASGNRDEEIWGDDADDFRVERSLDPIQVSFGWGEHMCLGAHLARIEGRVLFEELLERFSSIELAGEIVPLRSTMMNGAVRMPVVLR